MNEELVLRGETITPIHIGTLETINDFYIMKKGWRISTKKYMKKLIKNRNTNQISFEEIKNQIEKKVKEDPDPDKIYPVKIKENAIEEEKITLDPPKEFIKTYNDEKTLVPFIPGSSIKGAIRGMFPEKFFKRIEKETSQKKFIEVSDIYFDEFSFYVVPYKSKLWRGEIEIPIEIITNAKFKLTIKNLIPEYRTLKEILIEASKKYRRLYKIEKTLYPQQKVEQIEKIKFTNNIFLLRIGFGKFRFYQKEEERSEYTRLYIHKQLHQSKKPKYKKVLLDGKEYPLGWVKLEISE